MATRKAPAKKAVAKKIVQKVSVAKKAAPVKKKVVPTAFVEIKEPEFEPDALVIRTSNKDGTAYGGFQWPMKIGAVCEAPDWSNDVECGHGLHGLLDGIGAYNRTNGKADALWWVIAVKRSECIDLSSKVKFPRAKVVYFGHSSGAIKLIVEDQLKNSVVSKVCSMTAGDSAHSTTAGNYAHSTTAGYSAHSTTAGDSAHSTTAGYSAHSTTAGDSAHSTTAGNYAHSTTAGNYAHSTTAGNYAHSTTAGIYAHSTTAGDSAHSTTAGYSAHSTTAGNYAHSTTAGDSAHSTTAGDSAHSTTAGNYAHSTTAGYSAHSTTAGYSAIAAGFGADNIAKSSASGAIVLTYWKTINYKRVLKGIRASMVGENGIKPDTFYKLDEDGNFVEVQVRG